MPTLSLADIIAIVHLGYVLFVVLGFILIVVGLFFRWKWIRNVWLRILHLAAITAVAIEAILGLHCPLTVLEYRLRYADRSSYEHASFIGNLIDSLLFYDAPAWLFTTVYTSFAIVVVIIFMLAPPSRKDRSGAGTQR